MSMDATGVRSTASSSVASFENICKNAVLKSTLSLSGHVSGDAYLLALTNSVSASTGVEITKWTVGGQFVVNSRGAELLPTALLSPQRRHLSQTAAADFFQEAGHRDTYFAFAGEIVDAVTISRSAAADISAENLTPKRPTCLLSHSLSTQSAHDMVVSLTGLNISSSPERILKTIQDADTHTHEPRATLRRCTG